MPLIILVLIDSQTVLTQTDEYEKRAMFQGRDNKLKCRTIGG